VPVAATSGSTTAYPLEEMRKKFKGHVEERKEGKTLLDIM